MKKFIEDRCGLFLKDLETIVNIDSSSENLTGIEKVATFFKNRFESLELDTKIRVLGEKGIPCLEAVSKEADSFDIMFLGHMDTVFPNGEALKRPFSKNDELAFGPGVCDMKGGLVAILHVLETLKNAGILNALSICIAFNGDEETGSRASRDWIQKMASKSHRVFVFEPCRPGYNFVLHRKGGGIFNITAKGQAAHAGADPELGVNAVVELAHQIIAVNSLNNIETGTSAQATVVRGGEKFNIIPDTATAHVDIRISKKEEKERVQKFFQSLEKRPFLKNSKIIVTGNIDRPPMSPDKQTDQLWNLFKLKGKEMGIDVGSISTGGCSDANFTSSLGVPTIDGMGLVGAKSHRTDEFVELKSINVMVELTTQVCKHIAANK